MRKVQYLPHKSVTDAKRHIHTPAVACAIKSSAQQAGLLHLTRLPLRASARATRDDTRAPPYARLGVAPCSCFPLVFAER